MKICKVLSFEVQKQALIAGVRQGEMVPRRVFAASSRPRDLPSVKMSTFHRVRCPPIDAMRPMLHHLRG